MREWHSEVSVEHAIAHIINRSIQPAPSCLLLDTASVTVGVSPALLSYFGRCDSRCPVLLYGMNTPVVDYNNMIPGTTFCLALSCFTHV